VALVVTRRTYWPPSSRDCEELIAAGKAVRAAPRRTVARLATVHRGAGCAVIAVDVTGRPDAPR